MSMKGCLSCLIYCLISPIATTVNKYLFSYAPSRIILNRTCVTTYIQQIAVLMITLTSVCIGKCKYVNWMFPPRLVVICTEAYSYMSECRMFNLNKSFIRLAVLFCLQIFLCNGSLKHVQIASYQIARSTSSAILATMISSINNRAIPSKATIWSTLMLTMGFLLTSLDTNRKCLTKERDAMCLPSVLMGLLASLVGILYMQGLGELHKNKNIQKSVKHNTVIIMIHIYVYIIVLMPVITWICTDEFSQLYRHWNNYLEDDPQFHVSANNKWDFNLTYELTAILISALVVAPMPYCTLIATTSMSTMTMVVIGYIKSIIPMAVQKLVFKEKISIEIYSGMAFTLVGWTLSSNVAKKVKSQSHDTTN